MDTTQAQKLKFLNERLSQPFVASVAEPSYQQYPIIAHTQRFTGGRLNVDTTPAFAGERVRSDNTQAKRVTNERPSQPSGAAVAGPNHQHYPANTHYRGFTGGSRPNTDNVQAHGYIKSFAPDVKMDNNRTKRVTEAPNVPTNSKNVQTHGYAPPVNTENFPAQRFHTQRLIDQALNQVFGAEFMMPAEPQYPVNYHQPKQRLYQPFVAAATEPNRLQYSYTVNTQKPVVKLPVAEVTGAANMQQLTDTTNIGSDYKYDHETCVKMADEAIAKDDYPSFHTDSDAATAKLNSQVEQILSVLTRIDRTIHKFMPDRSIYVRCKFEQIEDVFASIRERIVKQETLDPREINRLAIHGEYVAPVYELIFVDSEEGLKEMLRTIVASIVVSDSSHPDVPSLSVDTEGEIALLQILVHAAKKLYIIDFTNLGDLVFKTSISSDQDETSLKTIFESSHILKLFWDVRGDSAMFHKFHNVTLRCVLDVQLMGLVTRRGYKGGKGSSKKKKILRDHKTVKSMGQAFHERCTEIPLDVRQEWVSIKEFGKMAMNEGWQLTQRLYDESGGIYPIASEILFKERFAAASGASDSESISTVTSTFASNSAPAKEPKDTVFPFDIRPLPHLLETYASNDVTALPVMYLHHSKHATWNAEVEDHVWLHSEKRLQDARVPGSGERLKGNENLAPGGFFEPEWLKETTK